LASNITEANEQKVAKKWIRKLRIGKFTKQKFDTNTKQTPGRMRLAPGLLPPGLPWARQTYAPRMDRSRLRLSTINSGKRFFIAPG
jgi:hypothetical protein